MNKGLLKAFTTIGLILTLGVSMSADAGLFGFGGDSWREEVLLHDGSKILVKRSQNYGGPYEFGQQPPPKEHAITFTLPGSNETITWKNEYNEDVGGDNFHLLAVHVLNGTPYVVTEPSGTRSYSKWGKPNPPYVFFKYDGKVWQRIPLEEFPVEFKTINVVLSIGRRNAEAMANLGLVSAEKIKELNSDLTQPEFKTILRTPIDYGPPRPIYRGPKAPDPITPPTTPNGKTN